MNAQQNFRLSHPATALFLALVGFFFGNGVAHADNIYVSNNGDTNTIEDFNSSGVGTVFASTGVNNAQGMAFDNSGNLYVDNFNNNTIEKFNSSGVGAVFVSGVKLGGGMAFDAAGNLYVVETGGSGNIEKFNSSGVGTVFAEDFIVGDFAYPAFDSAGNLYVASAGTITKYSSTGTYLGVFAKYLPGEANIPGGLAFDRSGNLYVDNFLNGTVEEFKSSGGVLSSNGAVFASGFPPESLQGLACDSAGNLYVVDETDNTIEEFGTNGVGTAFATFSSGVDEPVAIAVQVPEPATWALLTLGIGTLLGGRRLRRRLS